MAKRVTIQLVKQLICMLMVAVVLAPIIPVSYTHLTLPTICSV